MKYSQTEKVKRNKKHLSKQFLSMICTLEKNFYVGATPFKGL